MSTFSRRIIIAPITVARANRQTISIEDQSASINGSVTLTLVSHLVTVIRRRKNGRAQTAVLNEVSCSGSSAKCKQNLMHSKHTNTRPMDCVCLPRSNVAATTCGHSTNRPCELRVTVRAAQDHYYPKILLSHLGRNLIHSHACSDAAYCESIQ